VLRLGAILGFLGVAAGAFGAHGLRGRVEPELLEVWKTGALYQLLHALALVAVTLGAAKVRHLRLVQGAFVAGIALFSGSLYLLATTGVRGLGAVTPFGGAAFLVGWAALALGARNPGAS